MTVSVLMRALVGGAQTIQELVPIPETLPPLAPHPFGQLRFGTLSFAPTISLRDVGYDTNVFDLSGVERQPGDFTATIEPGLAVDAVTSHLTVRTLTRVSLVYYQTYKTEQAINPVMDFKLTERFNSRVALYAKGNYGYEKVRTGYEVDSRPRSFSQATTAGARLGGRKLQLDFHGTYGSGRFDGNAKFLDVTLAETLNETVRGAGLGVSYALSPYTSVTVGADEFQHRFPLASVRDNNETVTYVGASLSPRAVIAGHAAIGYTRLEPLSPLTPPFAGITPRAGLTYKLHDMLSFGVGTERGVENSFYLERPYYIYTLYEASSTLAILGRFDVGGSLQYTTLDYRNFYTSPSPIGPTDVVRMETVTVGAPIKKGVHAGVFAQRWRRISTERPYESLRIGMEMTVGPTTVSPRGIFLNGPLR